MFKKISQIIFTIIFILIITVPMLTTNLKKNQISEAEKRVLAPMAQLYNDDGSLNKNFMVDFETWINDNIGFRSEMVVGNAKIQYYGFNILSNNSNMLLGPNKELNYATDTMLEDYQHLNYKSEDRLNIVAKAYQICSDYLSERGIDFYYFQCWDKHSIYPEHFPNSIVQFGDESKTDQIISVLENNTTIKIISPKEEFITNKTTYESYSLWGDPTHWTQRGAYEGYKLLMTEINSYHGNKYKILQEEDYNITLTDQGMTLFGGIHEECYLENFEIKNPSAYLSDEAPLWLSPSATVTRQIYYNDNAGNNDTLLILGDSYFDMYLYDDFAESFHKVVLIWGDYTYSLPDIIDQYQPTIVVMENAERCERTDPVVSVAYNIDKETLLAE